MGYIMEIALFTFFLSTGFCAYLTYHAYCLQQNKKTIFTDLPTSVYLFALMMEGISLLLLDFAFDGLVAKSVGKYLYGLANIAIAFYMILFERTYAKMLSPKHCKIKGSKGFTTTNQWVMAILIYGMAIWLLYNGCQLLSSM